MASVIGSISGYHINPAVLLAILLYKKVSIAGFDGYILFQIARAITVTGILKLLLLGTAKRGKTMHTTGKTMDGIKLPTSATNSAATKLTQQTASAVLVSGKVVAFNTYNIEGDNYFKLRDIAMTLNGTEKQFDIGWDDYLDRDGICAVEWSEKMSGAFPKNTIFVKIKNLGGEKRAIEIEVQTC